MQLALCYCGRLLSVEETTVKQDAREQNRGSCVPRDEEWGHVEVVEAVS